MTKQEVLKRATVHKIIYFFLVNCLEIIYLKGVVKNALRTDKEGKPSYERRYELNLGWLEQTIKKGLVSLF